MASATKRWSLILTLLAITLIAVARVSGDAAVVRESPATARLLAVDRASSPANGARNAVAPADLRVANVAARAMSGDLDELFVVPPKPAPALPKALRAEPPKAPPLPLRLLGRMSEDGAKVLFLTWNDQHWVVRVGDVIDGTYRLESIARGEAKFVYLPLNIKQSLPVGEDD